MPAFSAHFRRLTAPIEQLVLPGFCVLCQSPNDDDDNSRVAFCRTCRDALLHPELLPCTRCGARLAGEAEPDATMVDCRMCRRLKLPFMGVWCVGNYEGRLRQLVLRMKNRGQETLAIQFGRWLGTIVNQELRTRREADLGFDVVTSIPAYWLRQLRRGYNVSELLAEGLTATLEPRTRRKSLLRTIRPTRKQGMLTTPQRFENVKACFALRHAAEIRDRHILIVDDVMTSGATAIEATKTLLAAGALSVRIACVARGVGQSH